MLARGKHWRVADVICTSGPQDRRFEERHTDVSIAMVLAGTFQYRTETSGSRIRNEVMSPGSLLLGSAGHSFDCGHEHGEGDRCISFSYNPELFQQIASELGVRHAGPGFRYSRLPAVRELSPLAARACRIMGDGCDALAWEEISLQLAQLAITLVNESRTTEPSASDQARVTRVLREIEAVPGDIWSLEKMSAEAGLSQHHFLRTFEAVVGITPNQFLLRTRLREAALRLAVPDERVVNVAFDCGFGDVSNFNRAFRREFGGSPRAYRRVAN